MISAVLPSNVAAVWPKVAPFISAAMDYAIGEGPEDLREQAQEDSAQLWMIEGRAAAITRVHQSSERVLEVVALGGEGLDMWIAEMVDSWQAFARDTDCRRIIATGRPGWKRAFRAHGFAIEKITGVMEVNDA